MKSLVELFKENLYLQFFISLKSRHCLIALNTLIITYFYKRQIEGVINDCNEQIVHYCLAVSQSEASDEDQDRD